jgi:hypothetical protein
MSLRSTRKAAQLAASDTHPSRTQRSQFGYRVVPIEVQDHHAVENPRSSWCRATPGGYCSAHVHRSERRLRNSILPGRFRRHVNFGIHSSRCCQTRACHSKTFPARRSQQHSVTELVYRHQIRPVIQSGATIMDRLFGSPADRRAGRAVAAGGIKSPRR